jgi:hypothetical protein
MGFFGDLTDSADAMAKFPTLLYNLFLAGGIVIITVTAFVGLAIGIGEIREPDTISGIVSAVPIPPII